MASMRDKLIKLVGKKVEVDSSGGYFYIKSPRYVDSYYDKIIEVGDDYFVVKRVFEEKHLQDSNSENTYAISGVSSIEGGL